MANTKTKTHSLTVLKPGALSLIQDFGRFGVAQFGITQGGPVDDYAYSWANYLLGNPVNCPTIEITLGQAAFRINDRCKLAIAGGDLHAKLDGEPITNWSSFTAQPGQVLSFSLARNGLRSYLAVKGGFFLTPQLGSVSTVQRDLLGGLHKDGRPLASDDTLLFHHHEAPQLNSEMTFRFRPDYNRPIELRVIESYQSEHFSESSLNRFYSNTFRVGQNSNRMGYRLEGESIQGPDLHLKSEGIALGSIQIPPDGQPIILLNDRQTIGGYPKVGCVARIDLPRLAQAKPGQQVTFVKGDLLGLQEVWSQWARFFGY
ncbi:biotin-dependent carboxyltransferase family protein [Vibrio mexicanus]|uniref:5-oxoprolinase subunit C family protein n=1 Tax=Vibrio mexicanus TaxID=1004326 RepID=UPI00063C98D8|nr:biotin-dependent carboxyltransferase family protein [Vibrio mexicanus]